MLTQAGADAGVHRLLAQVKKQFQTWLPLEPSYVYFNITNEDRSVK